MLRLIKRKMWIKFILAMLALLLLVGTVMVWFNIAVMKRISNHQIKNQSVDVAKIIENTMFDALAVGDNDTVRKQFSRISSEVADVEAYIYDFNGKVAFTTEKDALGRKVDSYTGEEAARDVEEMMESGNTSGQIFHTATEDEAFAVVNRVILNEKRCHHCHGDSNEVLGGITILASEQHALESIDAGVKNTVWIGIAGLCMVVAFVWIFFHFLVNKKINLVLNATEKMRTGDFTFSTETRSGDEMNHILNRIHLVNQSVRQALGEVVESSGQLNESASDLTGISETLSKRSRETSENSSSVSSAAEEMSSNLDSIAASMEEASSSLNTVLSASEEMSSTVGEISRNANTAKDVVDQSVEGFDRLTGVIDQLGKKAEDIDVVTREIGDIAEQVGLLALNAKIESARAGEAGKGFAVVAQEITDLSGEAGTSAKKVDEKIKDIRNQVKTTMEEIEKLTGRIHESDDAISGIATAVEEQSATSEEISNSITEVSNTISEVSRNVNEGAQAAGEIANKISQVDEASTQVENNSTDVSAKAGKLSEMADKLKELVARFTI
jgi:methyl-accepting chemotaxis protein